jgi:thiamine pyrophosphate-dependent acetolactate synthase large subunit-like protein
MLKRREVVKRLLADRGGLLVVTGLGAPTYDVAAAGDSPLNFYLWGAMGSAAMVGLGLAQAKPKSRVAVITGDGEMLMGMGALATIGVKRPKNLSITVIDNRHYGETGMQASHTASGVDLTAIAKACGFANALLVDSESGIDAAHAFLHAGEGPSFAQIRVEAVDEPRVLPTRDGAEIKFRFMQALAALGR